MLVLLVAAASAAASSTGRKLESFEHWAAIHGKVYATAALEERARENFVRTEQRIVQHNSLKLHTWRMGHTQFSDLTDQEFSAWLGGSRMGRATERQAAAAGVLHEARSATPAAVDWVSAGKVTTVKNQSHCGACWAFATVAAMESSYAIASSTVAVSLSPQDLISCMSKGSPLNNKSEDGFACGCSGADPDGALRWIRRNGVERWSARPYTNATAKCDGMHSLSPGNCNCGDQGDPSCPAVPSCPDACAPDTRTPAVTLSGYRQINYNGGAHGPVENTSMLAAVAQAPVVAEIDCEAKAFKNYVSGIISTCSKSEGLHNHVVLVVGYGTDREMDYWKVKNSFGAGWGERGYVRIQRDRNMCGIAGQLYVLEGARSYGD